MVTVLTLEIGARWLVSMSDEFFRPDAVAGIHHIEGRRGRWVISGVDVAVGINSHGFRDRERTRAKPPGTRRVVVLGDSMTEAFQVALEETFVARLERRLDAPHRPVEVLNLGISALGPAQEYLVYRAYGASYAPDAVVLMLFMANDFRNSVAELEGKPYLRYPVVAADGTLARDSAGAVRFTEPAPPARLRQWARQRLASYRFVRDRVLPALGRDAPAAASDDTLALYRDSPPPLWRQAIAVTFAMIAELDRAVRAGGARFVVLVLPAPWEVDPAARKAGRGGEDAGLDWRGPERRAQAWLAAHGIHAVGLADVFAADVAAGGRPYLAGDGHLTPHGHALVAERLAGAVEGML